MPPSQPEVYAEEVKEEKQNENLQVAPVAPNDVHNSIMKAALVACLAYVSKKIMQQGTAFEKMIQKQVIDDLKEKILASQGTADEPIDPAILNSFKALAKKYGMSFNGVMQVNP